MEILSSTVFWWSLMSGLFMTSRIYHLLRRGSHI
jgi:hypothetical protein